MQASSKRWIAVLLVIVAVASLGVVNASVFLYRSLTGNVQVTDLTSLTESNLGNAGMACTGFYIKGATSGNTVSNDYQLPNAGTNAPDANWSVGRSGYNGLKVTLHNPVCQWTNTSDGTTNTLYGHAHFDFNLTNGAWYFQDVLGFGYPKAITSPSPVYVWINVNQSLTDSNIVSAELIIYKTDGTTTTQVASIDLKSTGITSTPITLNSGEALQIDVMINVTGSVTSDSFTVGFYVSSSSSEQPR